MNKMKLWLLTALFALTACGSGGSESGSSPFGSGSGSGGGSTTVAVADLVVELSKSLVSNTGSDSVTIKATALDGNRNTLKGVPITVAADNGAIVTGGTGTTADNGTFEAAVSIGADRANRVINVAVGSGTVGRTVSIQVTGATLAGLVSSPVIAPGAAGNVQFRLRDGAGNAMAGQTIQVTAAGLSPPSATATTGPNGEYAFNFTAPTSPGSFVISANAGGATVEPAPTIQVQSVGAVGPISGVVTAASVSANPAVIGVNAGGSTANQTEIRALFLGANNQPIRNVRVWFDLKGDANSVGGTFTGGSSQVLYSDASGVVTTAYVPGSRSSPTNGVTIRACYSSVDVAATPANCTSSAETTLTITAEPLGVSIGTNADIEGDLLNFRKRFLVSVVDSAGNAMPDVNVSTSLDLPVYRKGYWCITNSIVGSNCFFQNGPFGVWGKITTDVCPNEDGNRNGVLETGEDINGSGRIEPGKSDVRIELLQSKTRSDGTVEVLVSYAQSFASWVDATITVSASGVSGSEGRAQYRLAPVPITAKSIEDPGIAPAFVLSPYGIGTCNMPP